MQIDTPTSELSLLKEVLRVEAHSPETLIVPNGDDAAVMKIGSQLLSISTDTIVEGRHFNLDYFPPEAIGIKAVESSASDIAAMGGLPEYIVAALSLPEQLPVQLAKDIFAGIYQSCERLSCHLIGGDITSGAPNLMITITVLGLLHSEQDICRRSSAKVDDLIYVSGPVGGSAAGLLALQNDLGVYKQVIKSHLTPACRVDIIEKIAPWANAMIDISDGLSSEIHHICRSSQCGAILIDEKIPIQDQTRVVARELGKEALDLAYGGGEDFELLYTIPRQHQAKALGHEIGVITEKQKVQHQTSEGLFDLARQGFDQLNSARQTL
jgi:thiamine-monophosphate kinase